ncbi:hypothetical protein FY036_16455 [Mesorhizobium microcysteis]|jgi:hypothetical protein|uniref:DUF3035 domain-containing protein n=1 Tax=Neoaquamicrobium microcysteis TaxID=2682781 RepID=A0A5D4GSC6_9HYPH|nr:hypothetical protein [Mesorhizobium microcysteis]TYR31024.1 hypothetical protein FY036_16455 [Mesorhizobium microcysteis]
MTRRREAELFALRIAPVVLALALAACSTTNIEDLAPVAGNQVAGQPAAFQETQQPAFGQPGNYPNLNIIPTPAAAQITPQQRRDTAATLRERRAQVASQGGGNVRDTSNELRRLARSHAEEALAEIEGE